MNVLIFVKDHDMWIQGGPSIKHYSVLSDKRRIITKDTEENVAVYDVLKVTTPFQRLFDAVWYFYLYLDSSHSCQTKNS